MPKIQLEVVPPPDPEVATILVKTVFQFSALNPYTLITGNSDIDYACGAWGVVLAAQVDRGQIANLAIKCGACNCYNAVRGS